MHTYYEIVNITLSVEDDVVVRARRRAESMGTSVNQLVRDYLESLAGGGGPGAEDSGGDEFEQLFRSSKGDSGGGWQFRRDEFYAGVLDERAGKDTGRK